MHISSLHIYPVKSCRGIDLKTARVGFRGLEVGWVRDRSWIITDTNNAFICQRQSPTLARVEVNIVSNKEGIADGVSIKADGHEPLILDLSCVSKEKQFLTLHGKEVSGHLAEFKVSQWFSRYLNKEVKVFYQQEDDSRYCNPHFSHNAGHDEVSFADGYPYLITTEASLELLNMHLETHVEMNRFRPNIVISTAQHEQEYGWLSIMSGEVSFRIVKPCTRCVMTTIDQLTGEKTGRQPLATLAQFSFLTQDFGKARVQGAIFRENAVPLRSGKISVGDEVVVQETKPFYNFRQPTKDATSHS